MNNKTNNEESNVYLKQVICEIQKQCNFSISNSKSTDLYNSDELLEFSKWYDEVICLAKLTPPVQWVEEILITESGDGTPLKIDYKPSNTKSKKQLSK